MYEESYTDSLCKFLIYAKLMLSIITKYCGDLIWVFAITILIEAPNQVDYILHNYVDFLFDDSLQQILIAMILIWCFATFSFVCCRRRLARI